MNISSKIESGRLTLRTYLSAPPEAVYNAWITPEILATWMAPGAMICSEVQADVVVGGAFEFTMRSTENEEHRAFGVYQEVEPNERLVFTWAWREGTFRDSLVSVLFSAGERGGTELLLTHERLPSEESATMHHQGWTGCLEKLGQIGNKTR